MFELRFLCLTSFLASFKARDGLLQPGLPSQKPASSTMLSVTLLPLPSLPPPLLIPTPSALGRLPTLLNHSRYAVMHNVTNKTFTLQIKDVQVNDSGVYRCELAIALPPPTNTNMGTGTRLNVTATLSVTYSIPCTWIHSLVIALPLLFVTSLSCPSDIPIGPCGKLFFPGPGHVFGKRLLPGIYRDEISQHLPCPSPHQVDPLHSDQKLRQNLQHDSHCLRLHRDLL
uniref:Immunoglobulin V-set domain-containing protein n=1 Tax=Callorhinchus milii TaxID=7868 RepID=A0A4W3J4B0_CALMI